MSRSGDLPWTGAVLPGRAGIAVFLGASSWISVPMCPLAPAIRINLRAIRPAKTPAFHGGACARIWNCADLEMIKVALKEKAGGAVSQKSVFFSASRSISVRSGAIGMRECREFRYGASAETGRHPACPCRLFRFDRYDHAIRRPVGRPDVPPRFPPGHHAAGRRGRAA